MARPLPLTVMSNSESLHKFIANLDSVRVHKSADGTATLKKPLTLLVVLSRILKGELATNVIKFADVEIQLRDAIAKYGSASSSSPNPADPFFYLRTSPFWRIVVAEGRDMPKKPSATALRKDGTYAALNDDLFASLADSTQGVREAMQAILKKWWPEGAPQELTRSLGL